MSTLFADLRHWMFAEALPFWGSDGIDREGGFVEHFSLHGEPHTATKRVFVICRQIYVFAHAAELGWSDGRALAEHGYRFLQKARLPDGGWARRLDRTGRPIDETPDLYVLSFVLFASAWYYRVFRDPQAIVQARETLAYIEQRLAHPAGGYLHEWPGIGPRQQNPHMHMVEGLLAMAEVAEDERFLKAAEALVDLFVTRFFDRSLGVLPEFFAENLERLDSPEGRFTEPGHQFEWAWILWNFQKLTGRDMREAIEALHGSAERHGVDPVTGATYNIVRDDGVPLNRGSRVWPNTERMKAAVALFELSGRPPLQNLEQSGRLLLTRYLGQAPRSCWLDNFDEHGAPTVEKIPTSSLYHVFLAFAEALRIEPALTCAP